MEGELKAQVRPRGAHLLKSLMKLGVLHGLQALNLQAIIRIIVARGNALQNDVVEVGEVLVHVEAD